MQLGGIHLGRGLKKRGFQEFYLERLHFNKLASLVDSHHVGVFSLVGVLSSFLCSMKRDVIVKTIVHTLTCLSVQAFIKLMRSFWSTMQITAQQSNVSFA